MMAEKRGRKAALYDNAASSGYGEHALKFHPACRFESTAISPSSWGEKLCEPGRVGKKGEMPLAAGGRGARKELLMPVPDHRA
jgi:hypothetical protein